MSPLDPETHPWLFVAQGTKADLEPEALLEALMMCFVGMEFRLVTLGGTDGAIQITRRTAETSRHVASGREVDRFVEGWVKRGATRTQEALDLGPGVWLDHADLLDAIEVWQANEKHVCSGCDHEPMCPECCLRVVGDLQTAARNKQLKAESEPKT